MLQNAGSRVGGNRFAKCWLVLLLLVLLEGEFLVYVRYSRLWEWPTCARPKRDGENLRIVLVSDPQLVGEKLENAWLYPITRWDCDAYVRKSMEWIAWQLGPDAVFVLGDVVDELSLIVGSGGSTEQVLGGYVTRVNRVFGVNEREAGNRLRGSSVVAGQPQGGQGRMKIVGESGRLEVRDESGRLEVRDSRPQLGFADENAEIVAAREQEQPRYPFSFQRLSRIKTEDPWASTPVFFVAGDNDVGGEGSDPLTQEKVEYFRAAFGPVNRVVEVGQVWFVIANTLALWSTSTKESTARRETEAFLDHVREALPQGVVPVLVCHISALPVPWGNERIRTLRHPEVVFASHWHKYNEQVIRDPRTLGGVVHQYTVPTVSYRMGTEEMGFVAVSVCGTEIVVKNFPLPKRYPYLKVYGFLVAVLVLGQVLKACLCRAASTFDRRLRRRKRAL